MHIFSSDVVPGAGVPRHAGHATAPAPRTVRASFLQELRQRWRGGEYAPWVKINRRAPTRAIVCFTRKACRVFANFFAVTTTLDRIAAELHVIWLVFLFRWWGLLSQNA